MVIVAVLVVGFVVLVLVMVVIVVLVVMVQWRGCELRVAWVRVRAVVRVRIGEWCWY